MDKNLEFKKHGKNIGKSQAEEKEWWLSMLRNAKS